MAQVWVDADACPNAIKEIVFRAAERTRTSVTLVANQVIRVPPASTVRFVQAPHEFDGADKRIVQDMEAGDLVVTADVPLAAAVIEKGGVALNPRGELYTEDNIRESLALRSFLEEQRAGGVYAAGRAPLDATDRKRFADQLDRLLARQARGA